jgi:hypothetical protein
MNEPNTVENTEQIFGHHLIWYGYLMPENRKNEEMDYEQSRRLKQENQGSICRHRRLEEEYKNGKTTGNKVCTACGHTIYSSGKTDLWARAGEE